MNFNFFENQLQFATPADRFLKILEKIAISNNELLMEFVHNL